MLKGWTEVRVAAYNLGHSGWVPGYLLFSS